MEHIYIIKLYYDDGKEQLLLNTEYMHLRSLEKVKASAAATVRRLNRAFVSSIIGSIVRYEIFEAEKIFEQEEEMDEQNDNSLSH